ncbi:hypothetical protein TanjilG_22373 [Lupinus angustifolius]|uniref:Bifunctional inhibitor/plant lipid transfer protein/seed storage helical domain-containing protein n=1 Tax=Lupinus angustifolius TaxID=3871 RepID=A0A4P1RS00_LUPAN|nr:hypothetical protein TanjilG_22373 [Lupinus angustifolius]
MMKKVSIMCAMVLVTLLLVEVSFKVEAVNCSPMELSSCLGAITSNSPPTSTCCQKLREQKPCLCGYIRNPALGQYINSPGARRVTSSCGVPLPTC